MDWNEETKPPDEQEVRKLEMEALRKRKIESWDELLNSRKERFLLSDDNRTAVLDEKYTGEWHSLCSDVSFETGVHFISFRVRSLAPTTDMLTEPTNATVLFWRCLQCRWGPERDLGPKSGKHNQPTYPALVAGLVQWPQLLPVT